MGGTGMSKYFSQVAQDLDVMPLHIRLRAHPEIFGRRNFRKDSYASPHSGMIDIWARYNDFSNLEDWDKFRMEPHESVWYPEVDEMPELKPIVFDLMRIVEGERLGAVLITKLPPGGEINPHIDGGWHASHYSKFYVPIQNGPGSNFYWEDGYIDPRLGEAWRFDNSVPHWVVNASDQDRISMIVCIKTARFAP